MSWHLKCNGNSGDRQNSSIRAMRKQRLAVFHNLIAERNNENEKGKNFYPLPRSLYDVRHFLRLWFKGQGFRGSHSKNHNNHRKADGSEIGRAHV